MRRLLNLLKPPDRWRVPVVVLLGILTGLVLYSMYVSRAPSYLSDRPETCTNCHIMAPQYATWSHSSHRSWTNCNDCHVPHNNALNKYYFKAKDGLRHASIFTLRKEPQVIFIKDAGEEAVQNNCIRCHAALITDSKLLSRTPVYHQQRLDRKCWECHQEVPHGTVNSLSSVPWARVPLPASPVPDWISKSLKK